MGVGLGRGRETDLSSAGQLSIDCWAETQRGSRDRGPRAMVPTQTSAPTGSSHPHDQVDEAGMGQ